MSKYFIAGGAGFIGSHLIHRLLKEEINPAIVVYDNFSSGKREYLQDVLKTGNIQVIKADIKDLKKLTAALKNVDVVYHFASNPDIAKAATQPDIDFWEGTYLTNNILEGIRINKVKKLIYASGSGVYGDTGLLEVAEDYAPMTPISTYGASKLAGEALICSYCHMFELQAAVFRFANVVGPHQTHGVGFDFINKLLKKPSELNILGDGSQSKSYIYVEDVINAIRILEKKADSLFEAFNVATKDYITVKEIADITCEIMNLKNVKYAYTGGNRGWKGDVPIVRLNSRKIRDLGWANAYSAKEAISLSVKTMYQDILNKKNKY